MEYTLPDKQVINVPGIVRFGTPELLFQPTRNGMTCDSMHGLAWKSVQGADIDVRKDLGKNILMSGGSTMFEGIKERLEKEIINLAPQEAVIKVTAQADRKYAVWKGGSTLASLSTFASSWVTKQDFEENGAGIIHRKCS